MREFKIGDMVQVDCIGKITEIRFDAWGKVRYQVDGEPCKDGSTFRGMSLAEDQLFPLVTPEAIAMQEKGCR